MTKEQRDELIEVVIRIGIPLAVILWMNYKVEIKQMWMNIQRKFPKPVTYDELLQQVQKEISWMEHEVMDDGS